MTLDPLVDGHGRLIGDLRVSVTDRCNFRCQYCMPAEGLPWLERSEILTLRGDRAGRAACWRPWASTTCASPAASRWCAASSRSSWRCSRRLAGLDDLSLTTNGYLLERDAARPRGRRRAARQRVDRLAPARPLLPDDPPRLPPAGAARPRGAGAPPGAAPDQGQRRRAARLHRGRGAALRRVRAPHRATRCASSSSCRSTPTTPGRADSVLHGRRAARADRRGLPARGASRASPRPPRASSASPTAQGEIGFINPVSEPFCGDCNRIRLTAEGKLRTCLFSLHETDLRGAAARGRVGRGARARSSATRSGARSSSTTSASRASGSRRAR